MSAREQDLTKFFHPILAAGDLGSAPRRFELDGVAYVLFRGREGKPAALLDACPHRRAPLSMGTVRPDGRLACSYHGWHFDEAGRGQSPAQPGFVCNATALEVVEQYGYLWVAKKGTPRSALPSMEWEGYELAGSFSTVFDVPLEIALDNFSEDEHFPYVHSFFGWDADSWPSVRHEVKFASDRIDVHYEGVQRPSVWLPSLGVKRGDLFYNDWTTRFDPVCATFTFHWFDAETREERPFVSRAPIFMVPETKDRTRFHVFLFLKLGNAFLRAMKPVVRRVAVNIAKGEIEADAAFVPRLKDASSSLEGMRLGAYDKALIRARRLLSERYYGEARTTPTAPWEGFRSFTVASRTEAGGGALAFTLTPDDGESLPPFSPGQHVTVKMDVPDAPRPVVRCYSLSDVPRGEHYRITVKRIVEPEAGIGSTWAHERWQPGARVLLRAPAGRFRLDASGASGDGPLVFVAGGIGITPLLSMVKAEAQSGSTRPITFFIGARTRADIAHRDEIEALADAHPRLSVVYCLSRAQEPLEPREIGGRFEPERLRPWLDDVNAHFFVCGPASLMQTVTFFLSKGGAAGRLHTEAFGPSSIATPRASDAANARSHRVRFALSGKTTVGQQGKTLLELAEASDIAVDFGCRAGSCGTCKTVLRNGTVAHVGEIGLELEAGHCLPCIAVPQGDVELDA